MNKRYVYYVGFSVMVGDQLNIKGCDLSADRPVTTIGDVNGWLKGGIINHLATQNPGWDAMSSTWRGQVVILGCSLLRTESQQPDGEWVAGETA